MLVRLADRAHVPAMFEPKPVQEAMIIMVPRMSSNDFHDLPRGRSEEVKVVTQGNDMKWLIPCNAHAGEVEPRCHDWAPRLRPMFVG